MSPEQVLAVLDDVASLTSGPIGANMLMPFLDRALVEAVAPRVGVFDFYHGEPDGDLVAVVHDAGALAAWQVGSRDEALAAIDAGCDLLAVRGVEGGGRMHGNQPLMRTARPGPRSSRRPCRSLPPAGWPRAGTSPPCSRLEPPAPVWAPGSSRPRSPAPIPCTSRRSSTRGATRQSSSPISPSSGPTVPNRIGSCAAPSRRHAAVEGETVGEMAVAGETVPIPKFAVMPPTAACTGNIEAWAMYAGVSAGAVDTIEPAADVIARIADEATALLGRAPGR